MWAQNVMKNFLQILLKAPVPTTLVQDAVRRSQLLLVILPMMVMAIDVLRPIFAHSRLNGPIYLQR